MDNGRNSALELGAQGEHIASITLSNQVVLQKGSDIRVVDHPLKFGKQAVMDNAHLGADVCQFWGSTVEDISSLGDGFGNGVHQAKWGW